MNSNYILIFSILIFINMIFNLANYKIAKYLNLIDVPDRDRKIHTSNVPLTGGFFYFLIFYLFFY